MARFEYEDSILVVTPIEDLLLDEHEMRKMLEAAVEFTGREKYYALIDMSNHVDSTPEARNYYANSELAQYRLADAFVVVSLATRLVTNFYFSINTPPVPSKMFNTKEDALAWLKQLKTNSSKPKHMTV